jgi:FixJ family two-component response regulator
MTIHILEDDPAVSDSLTLLLRNMGHQVLCYGDGESFLGAAPPAPEDTVIVDLLLPGISGAEVIDRLQKLEPPPRIVALSGQPRSNISKQLQGKQVAHLLRKPLTADAVAACLGTKSAFGHSDLSDPRCYFRIE